MRHANAARALSQLFLGHAGHQNVVAFNGTAAALLHRDLGAGSAGFVQRDGNSLFRALDLRAFLRTAVQLALGELFHDAADLLLALLDVSALSVLRHHSGLAHRSFAADSVVAADHHATAGELLPRSGVVAGLGAVLKTVHVTYLSCGLPPCYQPNLDRVGQQRQHAP